ncbi:MAG: YraN family protein [candidate division KSB1 bacterium]|nr:YraN family protein [candidate division KSB1 bacterium]MDZ7366159.1 YraN family protein [candidate division KSB1 bacterium]MDZ7404199.1 YraN family protein [candidate division KSB1 bacterium]
MPKPTQTLGSWGEQRAVEFLEKLGYSILHRNFRYGRGEIDIIADDNGMLVFVEVKTQKSDAMGEAFNWVTRKKQRQIGRVALAYLTTNGITNRDCRFDVIAVAKGLNGVEIKHLVNAFWL